MEKLVSLLKFAANNFGPLIVFYLSNHFYGIKFAIAVSVTYSIADVVYQKIKKRPVSTFFLFSAGVTLVFGAVDLYLARSVLFNYEPAITNFITALFFLYGAFKEKPLIQEFAERQKKESISSTPDRVYFFRVFTLIWSGYFFLKAGFYIWLAAQSMSLDRMIMIRSAVGGGSLYAMIGLSFVGGRRLFLIMKKNGMLPVNPDEETKIVYS